MSLQAEKKQLAEELQRALDAMQAWTPARRLRYKVALGMKDRNAELTRDFGGEATPEPDSVAMLVVPGSASCPLLRLLYLLSHGDDICLNAPTARSITGQPVIADLVRVLKDAETAHLVRRTASEPQELGEADRYSIVGLILTEQGRRYLEDVLRSTADEASPPRVVAR